MKTQIIKVDGGEVDDDWIRSVAKVLLSDGVIAYPTETFYGLGANCFSDKAVRKIYRLKKRDSGKPLSLIIPDLDMAAMIAAGPPPVFFSLAAEFWPGPLTLVLKAAPSFPADRTGPGHTIAIRIPPLLWLRRLLCEVGFPVTATSANLSGTPGLSEAGDVKKAFDGKVDVIVDGGKTPGMRPSTLIDLSCGQPRLIREGEIPASRLAAFL